MIDPDPPFDISELPLASIGLGVRDRRFTATEVVEAFIDRIHKYDPMLAAFVATDPDAALAAARAVDARYTAGQPHRALDGIPVGIKDLIHVAGFPTAAGSVGRPPHRPERDAAVVRRLRQCGAVICGKTTTYELGIGLPTRSDTSPPARNPWSPNRIPGGSSSGSAAAVAARLVPLAIGTDTGGSVRGPASYCGVVGFKLTRGYVSRNGVLPLAASLDDIGLLAAGIEDIALVFVALTAVLEFEPALQRVRQMLSPPEDVRIGIPDELAGSGVESDVHRLFCNAIRELGGRRVRIQAVALPRAEMRERTLMTIMAAESAAANADYLASDQLPKWRGSAYNRIAAGLQVSAANYALATKARGAMRREMRELMRRVDVVALPTTPHTAPTWDAHERLMIPRTPFTGLANLTGQPSVSVPIGLDSAGLPAAMMLTGRRNGDGALLQVAHHLQNAVGSLPAAPIAL